MIAIMMLYKNTKKNWFAYLMETDFSDIVAGVLQEDKLEPYLFLLRLLTSNVDSSKRKKKGKRFYSKNARRDDIQQKQRMST